jgi:hypothetical protein
MPKPLIDQMRTIVQTGGHARVSWQDRDGKVCSTRADALTAQAYVLVWDALDETKRERFAALTLPAAVSLAWKFVTVKTG